MSPGGIALIAVSAFAAGFALGCKPEKHSGDQRPDGDHPFIPVGYFSPRGNAPADDCGSFNAPALYSAVEDGGWITTHGLTTKGSFNV